MAGNGQGVGRSRGSWDCCGDPMGKYLQLEKALPVLLSQALHQPQADVLTKGTNKAMTFAPHLPSCHSLRNKVSISVTLAFLQHQWAGGPRTGPSGPKLCLWLKLSSA